uniref:Mitoferrin n=1 Tax=Clastoptera arizonana TaxID=38151 RepID=A0A1B6CQ11_9HEMI
MDDYESLPSNKPSVHMMAGAFAGVMEHSIMYPLDTAKTRMQSFLKTYKYHGILKVIHTMIKEEGVLRPYRGIGTLLIGAGPAHAVYFTSYEFVKHKMTNLGINNQIVYSSAGCVASVIHDAIMTPADFIKQRLQMHESQCSGIISCIIHVYKNEGLIAFYRSYSTQLVMNLPFQVTNFVVYESSINLLNPKRDYNPKAHVIAGAAAGAASAAITTPLDVCKTLLNTQEGVNQMSGIMNTIKTVYKLGGFNGFFKGFTARILFSMPSTAICWSSYEFCKYILSKNIKKREEKE